MSYHPDPDAAEDRIAALADPNQTVHAVIHTGGTEARAFYAVVRTWPHPDDPDLLTLSLQNAQLTTDWSDMSDTWMSGGYRQRVPKGNGATARAIAQSFAAVAARADADNLGDRAVQFHDASEGDQ